MFSTKSSHLGRLCTKRSLIFFKSYKSAKRAVSTAKIPVRLEASPATALVDDKTKYSVCGLNPGDNITLAAVLKEGSATFISHAHYNANNKGVVDLTQQKSVGGNYKGMEPMGLLWSVSPEEGSRPGIRMSKRDATTPFDIKLYAMSGHKHIKRTSDVEESNLLCTLDHPRTYMGPGVRRVLVREGKLRGALYLPPGDGPFPGVMDLYGTAGGLTEFRSALLASRGFASFALAYFNYDDLPTEMVWDMEYFEEAVDWFASHPNIKKGGIGAIGLSKGAELVTYMAIHNPSVKAVVCMGGTYYYSYGYHYKNRVEQPSVCPAFEDLVVGSEGLVLDDTYWTCQVPDEAHIPLERAKNAEFLFICGTDDRCTKPKHTDVMVERLKRHGKSNYQVARYPGAGHLIEPPYTPLTRSCYHKTFDTTMLFGGQTLPHAYAQEDSWQRILKLFDRRVGRQDHDTSSQNS